MNRPQTGTLVGSYYWPHTRIGRRGRAGHRNLRMRGRFKILALYLGVFFLFALAYVWTRVQVVESGYRIRVLEEGREKLKEENRSLAVEAATLRSVQRLEGLARLWGLKRPREGQVFFLK